MLRILIADDEYYFRQFLKANYPWEAHGFAIVGEASNGEDAMDMMERLLPDVTLLDINMPLKNGIEICRRALELRLPGKIVILSGHVEFSFAQQAVQYGVKRYLLKPVDMDELHETLLDLQREHDEEARYKLRMEDLEHSFSRNLPKLRAKILDDLLADRQGGWDAEAAAAVGLFLRGPAYTAVALAFDDLAREDVPFRDWELWKYAVCNIACELFGERFTACHSCEANGVMYFLLEHPADAPPDGAVRVSENICRIVGELLNYTVSAGVGNRADSPERVCISAQQALVALRGRAVGGHGTVRQYGQPRASAAAPGVTMEEKRELLLLLRTGEAAAVEEALDSVFAHLRGCTVDEQYGACVELFSLCLEFGGEFGVGPEDFMPAGESPFDMVQLAGGTRKAQDVVAGLFTQMMAEVFHQGNKRKGHTLEEVKAYVDGNFMQPELKITDIADALHITYHHLCHSFKKQSGVTINQYILEKRIAHARGLIDGGHSNVALIAQKSGFNDAGYFSRCFKRAVGLSPSQYIRLALR